MQNLRSFRWNRASAVSAADSWLTPEHACRSGAELYESSPGVFAVHSGHSCQLTFDLACLLRLTSRQALQGACAVEPKGSSAHSKRSLSALEAEFSGSDIEQQLASCGEVTDSAFYARWLHVKGGHVNAAKQAIAEHAKWRAMTTPGGVHEVIFPTPSCWNAMQKWHIFLAACIWLKSSNQSNVAL